MTIISLDPIEKLIDVAYRLFSKQVLLTVLVFPRKPMLDNLGCLVAGD